MNGSGQLATEDGGAVWQRPVVPAFGLALANDAPSPGVLLAMAVSGRWMLGHNASEAEVFLAADQALRPHGGGSNNGRAAAMSPPWAVEGQ
jgi:hypothetical protein